MLGNIDVEILIDEGPDNETVMGDVFDLLMALAQNNVPVPPQAIIEASTLPLSEKKKLQAMISQPDPMKQQAQQLLLADKQADIQKKQAEIPKIQTGAMLNAAKARTEGLPAAPPIPPSPLDLAQKLADINETNATAAHKRASATQIYHGALFQPLQTLADHAQQNAQRAVNVQQQAVDTMHQNADRVLDHFHQTANRESQMQLARMKAMRGQPPE